MFQAFAGVVIDVSVIAGAFEFDHGGVAAGEAQNVRRDAGHVENDVRCFNRARNAMGKVKGIVGCDIGMKDLATRDGGGTAFGDEAGQGGVKVLRGALAQMGVLQSVLEEMRPEPLPCDIVGQVGGNATACAACKFCQL